MEAAMAEAQALAGKVAIITGSGKNIGKAITQALAHDGAAVVVNGRGDRAIVEETAQEIRAAGGRAMPFLAHISKPDAVAAMVEAAVNEFGGGAFVGLSGISHHAGASGRVHVNASKAGLEGFVRGLAIELAPHGITANCVAPGSIDTVRGASAGGPHGRGLSRDIPLGRQGRPEEIAAMVHFLAGPEGRYLTGQTIHVNGGLYLAK
jgi:3-oxoacyl-[acyl-carrier protein] reductase